jgi:hypothetical protein
MYRWGQRVLIAAGILSWLAIASLIPFWHRAADHFHYALPGRVPERVEYKGREYIEPDSCLSKEQITQRFGASGSQEVSLRRIGTV